MLGALVHPTETAREAQERRRAFHDRIAGQAAALAAAKRSGSDFRAVAPARHPIAPEAMPAEPDPPRRPIAEVVHSIEDFPKSPINTVLEAVADHYRLTVKQLLAERREVRSVRARQIAMYLCREFTGRSFPEIGRRFGGRDHTTVMHACRRIEAFCLTNEKIARTVERLSLQLKGRLA